MIPEETIQQVCVAIEAETHTITWKQAPLVVRLATIRDCIEQGSAAEPAEAGKTPKKQRKQRTAKPKPAPLTQHATAQEDE